MAIAFVQGPAAAVGVGVTSLAIAFASNCTNGNLLIAALSNTVQSATKFSITDTLLTNYDQDSNWNSLAANHDEGHFGMARSTGANTVTWTTSGGAGNIVMAINEYSGASIGLDNHATATATSAAAASGAVTAGENNSLYFAIATTGANAFTLTWAGATERQNNTATDSLATADLIGSGSQDATWTLTSALWRAHIMTFRPLPVAATGGGGRAPGPGRRPLG